MQINKKYFTMTLFWKLSSAEGSRGGFLWLLYNPLCPFLSSWWNVVRAPNNRGCWSVGRSKPFYTDFLLYTNHWIKTINLVKYKAEVSCEAVCLYNWRDIVRRFSLKNSYMALYTVGQYILEYRYCRCVLKSSGNWELEVKIRHRIVVCSI